MATRQVLYKKLKGANVATFETMCEDIADAVAESGEGNELARAVIQALISYLCDRDDQICARAAFLLYRIETQTPLLSKDQIIEVVDTSLGILRRKNVGARMNAAQLIGLIRYFEGVKLNLIDFPNLPSILDALVEWFPKDVSHFQIYLINAYRLGSERFIVNLLYLMDQSHVEALADQLLSMYPSASGVAQENIRVILAYLWIYKRCTRLVSYISDTTQRAVFLSLRNLLLEVKDAMDGIRWWTVLHYAAEMLVHLLAGGNRDLIGIQKFGEIDGFGPNNTQV